MADTLCRCCFMPILAHGPFCKTSKGVRMGLKERVEEEIRKGIEGARRQGVVIPDGDINVVITPIPVPITEENEEV